MGFREALLANLGPVGFDGVDQLSGAESTELFQRRDEAVVVFAEAGETLEPLEELDDGAKMAAGGLDGVFSCRHGGAVFVVFGLAIVGACPVFQYRYVHADLHCLGAGEEAFGGHDSIEEFGSEPIEELGQDL